MDLAASITLGISSHLCWCSDLASNPTQPRNRLCYHTPSTAGPLESCRSLLSLTTSSPLDNDAPHAHNWIVSRSCYARC
ncbi:hypothetical protein BT96DRAFT_925798 [Gymnopus androsaceus JB14]|uniref:Uncharacterized protein n=1 Tax=Gymnopus androsaceus JB14 TaxID=1447944 RepID=A0A6A4GZR3_9AGAR|nr:hypothetical protein BT96DRAFT_925798 [Gymnopus androsaceus JB14]